MRTHHKPPSLVSMWMLDVFCCALGCVSLLFLINSRIATDEARANKITLTKLEEVSKAKEAALKTAEDESQARVRTAAELAKVSADLQAVLAELKITQVKLDTESKERERLALALTREEKIRRTLVEEAKGLRDRFLATERERDDLAGKLVLVTQEAKTAQALLDATTTKLIQLEKQAGTTAQELIIARAQIAAATDLLTSKKEEIDRLASKLAVAATAMDDLRKLIREKDAERLTLEQRLVDTQRQLSDTQAQLRATQKALDDQLVLAQTAAKQAAEELALTRAAAKTTADELALVKEVAAKTARELAAAREQIQTLTKKVDAASAVISALQSDKQALADRYEKFQKEVEARFAGIALTGKKAVFMVDMSGSMGKRDVQTLDPDKWPLVVEAVCQVMRSIPTLEYYQVLVFSGSAHWLFDTNEWLRFHGEKSVARVKETLLKIEPREDTNLYLAFEKAFTLRSSGLDTVYLFSDGLPTSGPGLTPAQMNLTEEQRGPILGRYVRNQLTRVWNRPEPGRPPVKINAIGFYFESVDVGAFLWALARDNHGSFVGMSRP